MDIHISDSKGRDAQVSAESVTSTLDVHYIDDTGNQAASRKILRGTLATDISTLLSKEPELDNIGEHLVSGDPEVDIETFGSFLEETSRVYMNDQKEIVHKITRQEILYTPDGVEKERRPKQQSDANIAAELPLKWSGKKLKKSAVVNRFVFANKAQIKHVNGLTYDFLYQIAKELEDEDSMLLVAGGEKGNEPLIFRRGSLPYRGFLEGRTQDKKYILILHLSNMELKTPEQTTTN
jgi:hypothetical protein